MTLEIKAGVALGVLISLAVLFLFRSVKSIVYWLRERRSYLNSPHGVSYERQDLCNELHSWSIDTELAIQQVPPGFYNVCKRCGLIQGTEYRLNSPGLEVLNEGLRLVLKKNEERERVEARIEFDLEAHRDRWIDVNLRHIVSSAKRDDETAVATSLEHLFRHAINSRQDVLEKAQAELSQRHSNTDADG